MTQNWWNTNQGQGKQALKRQKKGPTAAAE